MLKFYTKRDVDKHVSHMSQKLNEKERSSRGLHIARCYVKVNEWDHARDWLQRYLDTKQDDPTAHRLMAEIYERLHKTEEAITSYQRSYNLNPKQNDIIKHVCRLYLLNGGWSSCPGKVKYWCELAENENIRDENIADLQSKIGIKVTTSGSTSSVNNTKERKSDVGKLRTDRKLTQELSSSFNEEFNNNSQNGYTDDEIFHNASSSSFRTTQMSFAPMPNYNEKFADVEDLIRKLSDLVISVKEDVLCVRNDITSLRDDILNIRGDITDLSVNKDATTAKAINDVNKSIEDLSWNVSCLMNLFPNTTGPVSIPQNLRFPTNQLPPQFNQMYNTAYPIYPPIRTPLPQHLQYGDPLGMNLIMNAANYGSPLIASPQQPLPPQQQQPISQQQNISPAMAVQNGQKSSLLEALNTSSVLNTWNNTFNAAQVMPSTVPQINSFTPQQPQSTIGNSPSLSIPQQPSAPPTQPTVPSTQTTAPSTQTTAPSTQTTAPSTQTMPVIQNKLVEKTPVNVVITSSDPLPTQNSLVTQPTLSVTIPPQHIKQSQKEIIDKNKTTSQPSPFANFTFGGSSNKSFTELFSNLSATKSDANTSVETKLNTSSVTSAAQNDEEADHFEPTAHFEPVIPLPDLVEAKTGEEEENVTFCHRAKLLRYDTNTKEWKERGLGEMKVLVNKTDSSKARLLMRREQVLKICCNMPITKELKFTPRNATASTFGGQDFSEGEMRSETLTIKFKTADLLKNFQEAVLNVQKNLTTQTPQQEKKEEKKQEETKGFGDLFKPKAGSWTCEGCYISNKPDALYCVACESPKDNTVPKKEPKSLLAPAADAPKFSFGMPNASGFSFGMPQTTVSSVVAPAQSTTTTTTLSNTGFSFGANTTSAPSNFTFGKQADSNDVTSTKKDSNTESGSGFKFNVQNTFSFAVNKDKSAEEIPAEKKPEQELGSGNSGFNFVFKKKSPSKAKSPGKTRNDSVNSEGGDGEEEGDDNEYHEEEENQAYFTPVIPLPDKVEVKTGEEDEEVLYSHRSKLYRFVDKEWKERGIGDIKILKHKKTGKLRVVMRREQVLKICLNFVLNEEIDFKPKDDTSFRFAANDFSEGVPEPTFFAIRFKTKEIRDGFKKAIDDALAGTLGKSKTSSNENDELIKKLMLPSNFFNYLNAPDCVGCLGCKPDEYVYKNDYKSEVIEDENSLPLKSPKPLAKSIKPRRVSQDKRVSFNLSDTKENKNVFDIFGGKNVEATPDKVKTDLFGIKKSEATTNIFAQFNAENPPSPSSGVSTSIFGSNAQNTTFGENKGIFGSSIFSSSLNTTPTTNTDIKKSDQPPSLFGNQSSFSFSSVSNGTIFGSANKENSLSSFGNSSLFGTTKIFGSSLNKSNNSETKLNDSTTKPTNIFSSSNSSSFSFAEAAKELDKSSDANKSAVEPEFLKNTNSIGGFAELAAASSSNAFSGQNNSSSGFFGLTIKEDVFSRGKNNVSGNADASHDDSENVNDDNYDPHYDPIISLPDEVKVSTGEEDEEKLFGERAKLFRYDANTKEWKERGVGEMKILHHPTNNTYRMILRREQIFKLVLNQLLTPDIHMAPMGSSPNAFCWAGMNYAEVSSGEAEQLAVRFKNEELANSFKQKIEECQAKIESQGNLHPEND